VDFNSGYFANMLLRAPVILIALPLHEFMHGWVAWKCGDNTAKDAGRLTLNPLAHLDVLGTIMLFFGPIGWAKPVPVNFANLDYEHRRRDEVLISGAGVAANFVLALVLVGAARILVMNGYVPQTDSVFGGRDKINFLWAFLGWGMFLNFGLAIFNLLPLFPLDGSHILKNLLPLNAAIWFASTRQYQPYVLLALVLSSWGGLDFLGWPVYHLMDLLVGPRIRHLCEMNMWLDNLSPFTEG
jgi:Zn-dependent protease